MLYIVSESDDDDDEGDGNIGGEVIEYHNDAIEEIKD